MSGKDWLLLIVGFGLGYYALAHYGGTARPA